MTSRKDSADASAVQPVTDGMGALESRFAMIPAHAIDDPDLTLVELRVLGVIAYHSDRRRAAWPKQQTIADRLKITRETVNRAVKRLAGKGLIEVRRQFRPDGGQRGSLYVVKYDVPIEALDIGAGDEDDTQPAPPPVTAGSHPPVIPAITPPVIPAITPTKDEQTNRTEPPNPLTGADLREVLDEIWEAWPADGRRRSSGRDKCFEILRKVAERFPLADIRAAAIAYAASKPKFGTALSKWLREGMFESWIPRSAAEATHMPKTTASIKPPTEQGEKLLAALIAVWGEISVAEWFSDVSWEAATIRTKSQFDAYRIETRFGGVIRDHGFRVA